MIASGQIRAIQDTLKSVPCRIIPTSFEAEDVNLVGFPLHPLSRWDSCAQALSEFKSHGVMMRLPLFWQLEVLLWYACRTVPAPIFLNDPENMPVGAAALQLGGMDTVVTEQRDAGIFAEYVQKENEVVPKNWIIVHRADDTWSVPTSLSDCKVAQEVHLFPGLPILSQCPALMTEISGTPRFHIAQGNRFEPSANTFETPSKDAVPSFTLDIPRITAGGMCVCGDLIYTQAL
ncbi:MAG: hypothetical protein JW384_00412 [Nitrosomonadaceae bacterium]|nr:hypothetical protein [Nitrosomonadaceae bacterium]